VDKKVSEIAFFKDLSVILQTQPAKNLTFAPSEWWQTIKKRTWRFK
jgi:hypothetical protein